MASLAAVLVAMLAVTALTALPPWHLVEARLFDVASTIDPKRPEAPGAVIVAVDEPSFSELGLQWPWPRAMHARLVESLRAAGAKVIGLDIIFAEPTRPEDDDALAAALGPDVVLASDLTRIDSDQAETTIRVEPLAALVARGAKAGLASVSLDGDGVLRVLPTEADGFAAQVLATAGTRAPSDGDKRLVQFFGPARSYPTVSYYQALDPGRFLPPDTFRGKTVLVGLSLQNAPTIDRGGADSFTTPWSIHTGRLTPGVEVQATILDNLAAGLAIRPLGVAAELTAAAIVALLAGFLTLRRVTWRTVVVTGLGTVAIALGAWLALREGRVWLPPSLPILAGLLVVGVQGGRDFVVERRRRRAITRAFSHYLAPEMVERLARDPSLLRLGGERRRLSILFCDVRGFTTLAERMQGDPERLTSLINRLLDPLSAAVLDHGGTIDKYIGDCVMAFWNAPLDDTDHEAHAVACGLAMLDGLAGLNRDLASESDIGGPTSFSIGIGINTGECIVGNIGSNRRFDYSALGDAVNLASRLEGMSKRYGVAIVLGEATARAVAGRFLVIELDLLAVKGRREASPIYTVLRALQPGGDPAADEILATQATMLAAYRARRWDEAEAALARLAALAPGLAAYAAAVGGWIAAFRLSPPSPNWAGAYQADSK